MKIGVLGVNHDTASVEQRELLSHQNTLDQIKDDLRFWDGIEEFAIIATCGRFEIYFVSAMSDYLKVSHDLMVYIGKRVNHQLDIIYHKTQTDAVNHLFKVACGLNSAVLGEDQILGQVKNSIAAATEEGFAGKLLNKLFRESISFSKMVRTSLKFSENPLSLSYIATKKAHEAGYLTADHKVAMIGLGKMGGLAIKHLLESPVQQIVVSIRSPEKLSEEILNHPKVRIETFEARYHCIMDSDLVISSTAAPHTVIRRNDLIGYKKGALWIDLAMPRDIESCLSEIEDLTIWHVDHLKDISESNYKKRESLGKTIEDMMVERVDQYITWVESIGVDDVIREWQTTIHKLTQETMLTIKRKNLASDERNLLRIERLIESSLKKMVKPPIEQLKNIYDQDKRTAYIKMLKELYRYE
ncbi:MAG: glutamyl-tRNA reductase [Clostridia bacterium]|nr:glutamyl-tRNA reductase [Clostridia bacterium]